MPSHDASSQVLVVNCGSSSIKFRLYDMPSRREEAQGVVDRIGSPPSEFTITVGEKTDTESLDVVDHDHGMELILNALMSKVAAAAGIDAVGHRVVHGGERFSGSVLLDDEVIASVDDMSKLAPLHNPPNLAGIRAARRALPGVPQVACFDTAFHAGMPKTAYLYALPYSLYEQHGVRRYGFHGTSHRYVTKRAAELLDRDPKELNAITCHMGNGSSLAAVQKGISIDTSMGMTPLEGVPMGTRSGDFDPAILLLLAEQGHDWESLGRMCNRESGLLGISGTSHDLRELSERAEQHDERARLAIEVLCYRVKKYIGAYLAVLSTIDALVLTGGIGENAPRVREGICQGLGPLGIELDADRNEALVGAEGHIEVAGSRCAILVIPTDEEGVIAEDTYQLVG